MSVDIEITEAGASPLESLRQFVEYHWLMVKVFAEAVDREHGREAVTEVLQRGAAGAGEYRGLTMHDDSPTIVEGRSIRVLLENWHGGEFDIAAHDGDVEVAVGADEVALTFPRALGLDYVAPLLPADLAVTAIDAYWAGIADGITREYAPGEITMEIGASAGTEGPWTITFRGPVGGAPNLGARLDESPRSLLEVNRRTTGLLAALQLGITRYLVDTYDASGEETVRQAAYRFGADRGSVIRERISAKGLPLTLKNFGSKEGLQERDPGEAVFVYRDRQHLSDGAYYIDCTYCPLAEVWKSNGEESLDLAYLFDASNHRGLFQSYNPETEVRWHSVQSRGDTVCRFRFTVPSMLTDEDPTPEEWDAGDPFGQ